MVRVGKLVPKSFCGVRRAVCAKPIDRCIPVIKPILIWWFGFFLTSCANR